MKQIVAEGQGQVHVHTMKPRTAKEKAARRDWLLASCEATRQRCNKLTDEERRRYRDMALATIYGLDAKATARSR